MTRLRVDDFSSNARPLSRLVRFLVAVIVGIAPSACANEARPLCFDTEQSGVSLKGIVESRAQYGPPTFGENPSKDEKLSIHVLKLETPIAVCRGTSDEIDIEPIANIDTIQLIGEKDRPFRQKQRAVVSGKLIRADNAFHFTDVLLIVESYKFSDK